MVADEKIRKEIRERVEKVPSEKLDELLAFIKQLEGEGAEDEEILSFFGLWEDIDEALFEELTTKLPEKRLEETEGHRG